MNLYVIEMSCVFSMTRTIQREILVRPDRIKQDIGRQTAEVDMQNEYLFIA